MNAFKILMLVISAIFFVVAGSIFILGKGVDKTLLQTSFYEEVIEELNVSSVVKKGILSGIRQQITKMEDSSGFSMNQTPEQREMEEQEKEMLLAVESATSQAFSEEWIEKTSITVIDDVLTYLKGEQDELNAVVNLKERKEVVRKELKKHIDGSIEIPKELEDQLTPMMKNQLEAEKNSATERILSNFPEKIVLANSLENHPESREIKNYVNMFQSGYKYFDAASYAILFILAILMILLAGVSGGLKWIGVGMFASGALTTILLLGVDQLLPFLIKGVNENLPWERLSVVTDLFVDKIYIFALIYAGVGLIVLLLRKILGKVWPNLQSGSSTAGK
ncbi:MAG: hypothetical protein R6V40_04730 [Candidatus Moraniibacteriota bacterium]